MGIEKKAFLACDRCGREIEVDKNAAIRKIWKQNGSYYAIFSRPHAVS